MAPEPESFKKMVRGVTAADIDNWFTYHPPTQEQVGRYTVLRDAAKAFALSILNTTPPGADQTAALRKVRETVATANMAIACEVKRD